MRSGCQSGDDYGFQLGQFGHHYSSMFLAVTVTKVALDQAAGLDLILDTIFSGWAHGRETPPLLGLPWEDIWHEPIDTIRATGWSESAQPCSSTCLLRGLSDAENTLSTWAN